MPTPLTLAFMAIMASVPPGVPPPQHGQWVALERALESNDEAAINAAVQALSAGPTRTAGAAEAALQLGSERRAKRLFAALAEAPGWKAYATRRSAELVAGQRRRSAVRFGQLLFSACLAILALGGSRELLRPSGATAVAAVIAALLYGAIYIAAKPLIPVAAVLGVSVLGLVHAGAATIRRTAPTRRGRMMLICLVALGIGGAGLAVVFSVDPGTWAALAPGCVVDVDVIAA